MSSDPVWSKDLPWDDIELYSEEFKLDHNLVAAIIMAESGNNPWAMRYEPDYRWTLPTAKVRDYAEIIGCTVETFSQCQKFSYGPMQIMGAIAYDQYGFRGWPSELCSNDHGIYYGCAHLSNFRLKYPEESQWISAYNAGHPGKTKGGMFINQRYVDKVYSYLLDLRKVK